MKETDKTRELTEAEIAANELQVVSGIQYPADRVRSGLKTLIAAKRLNEAEAELVFWFYSYGQDNGFSYRQLGEAIGMSQTVAYHIVKCDYAASYKNIVAEIAKLKKHVDEESKRKSIGFVETKTSQDIFRVCESALYDHMPSFIYGASQIGKTTALLEFQRTHNHGTTRYIRMGSKWSKARFVEELSVACKCYSNRIRTSVLERKIFGALSERNLLIIDEFHLALFATCESNSREIMEYIREVYDLTGCGIVFSGTPVAAKSFEEGKYAKMFDQLRRRGLVKLVLPDVPPLKDINTFARSFDLPVPTGTVLVGIKEMLHTSGLGKFVKYLQKSYALAKAAKKPLDWETFMEVTNGYARLAIAKNDY